MGSDNDRPGLNIGAIAEFYYAYIAALVATALPFVVGLEGGLVLAYLLDARGAFLLLGPGSVAAIWLVLAFFVAPLTTARRANAGSYQELTARLKRLRGRANQPAAGVQDSVQAMSRKKLRISRREIRKELSKRDPRWTRATGYTSVWRELLAAEAEAFELLTPRELVDEGLRDELRLHGSGMPDSERLLNSVRRAVQDLDPQAGPYLLQAPPERAEPAPDAPGVGSKLEAARAALRLARSSIDEYRNTRYDGLVQTRAALLNLAVLMGLALNVLVGVAVIRNVGESAVVAGLTFYVVGVVAGWLRWWHTDMRSDKLINDYGLGFARLESGLTLSGAAALGGVALFALLPAIGDFNLAPATSSTPAPVVVLTPTTTPEATLTATTVATGEAAQLARYGSVQPVGQLAVRERQVPVLPSREQDEENGIVPASCDREESDDNAEASIEGRLLCAFDLENYPVGLFIAALFGFAPQLLIGFFQLKAEQYKKDLRATEAGDRGG